VRAEFRSRHRSLEALERLAGWNRMNRRTQNR
jgi:hypothetical protein